MEKRYIEDVEFRTFEEDDKKYIEGFALRYNSESKDLGGFKEIIEPTAINENTRMDDIICLFNHSNNFVLARKNADVNTLEIELTSEGLKYRFEVDMEISYHRDLFKNIQKGNINKSSFAFNLPRDGSGERFEKRDGQYYRYITQFDSIVDCSVVTTPAYDNTYSGVRSFDEIKKELDSKDTPIEIPIESTHVRSTCDLKFLYHKLNSK